MLNDPDLDDDLSMTLDTIVNLAILRDEKVAIKRQQILENQFRSKQSTTKILKVESNIKLERL